MIRVVSAKHAPPPTWKRRWDVVDLERLAKALTAVGLEVKVMGSVTRLYCDTRRRIYPRWGHAGLPRWKAGRVWSIEREGEGWVWVVRRAQGGEGVG